MQEVKKRRIVLASVLKPVNDPRMFEKMGQTLSREYEVHIIGSWNPPEVKHTCVIFHPLTSYSRLSLNRILAPLRILKRILSIKPDLLIISTHELLWMVLAAKLFIRCKVIYDIRENYFRNILYTNAFPGFLRIFIASYVRIKERITSPLINNFFLAEAGYEQELDFLKNKQIIVENKVKKIPLPATVKWSASDGNIHLLFSGTLALTTGVFIAIGLASKLHALEQRIQLHIIGYSPLHSVYRQIRDLIKDKPFIHFQRTNKPVPHPQILKAIKEADFGIIAYPPNPSTQNTIPTKLFEYMGYTLPILLIDHEPWVEMCKPYDAAIPFNLTSYKPEEIIQSLKVNTFYSSIPTNVFWETEEEKFMHTVSANLSYKKVVPK